MRLEKVDLNLFVVFDAIYRERSVTKVAEHLNLTQPAVSNALNRLRQTFDDPLFERTPDGMSPTPVADNVVADVRKALSLLGRSVSSNASFDPATSEKAFHLGMNSLAEALLLPLLYKRIESSAPHTTITSFYDSRDSATNDLKAGNIDILLDTPLVNAKHLSQMHLGESPYVVAMRKKHPMARRDLSMEDYLACGHIHVSSRRKGRGQMDVALHNLGFRRRIPMRVRNYLIAAKIAEQTDLLWTVPSVLAKELPLQSTPLPFNVDPLVWNLYWPKGKENDPAIQWMSALLKESADTIL